MEFSIIFAVIILKFVLTMRLFKNHIIKILYSVLFILVPMLAYLQYEWIGELSRQEKEKLLLNLETDCHKLSLRILDGFRNISDGFFLQNIDIDSVKASIISRIKGLRAGKYSDYVSAFVYAGLSDSICFQYFNEQVGTFEPPGKSDEDIDYRYLTILLSDSHRYRMPGFIGGNFQYIILFPLPPENQEFAIVIVLEKEKILNDIISMNYDYLFPKSIDTRIYLSIANNKDSIVFSNDYLFNSKNKPDFFIPMGFIAPFKTEMPGIEFPKNRHGEKSWKPALLNGDRRMPGKVPGMNMPFVLKAGFKPDQLESLVDEIRFRNLAVSFSILILLTIVIILITINLQKSKKLADRQLQFVAGISHELRTPLAVIRSAAQNLSDGIINEQKKALSYGALILNETNKLWEMIETTLLFAGVQTNIPVLNFTTISLQSLIIKSVETITIAYNKREAVFEIGKIPREIAIYGNEQMLMSVFVNIFSNSVKFCINPPRITVNCKEGASKNFVIISIEDNGPGIPAEETGRVLQPFFRGKISVERNIPGNGIGLALVNKAVELHRGSIKLQSYEGNGTKVIIKLPVCRI
jgi:signal transduction histidine kinase